MAMGGIKCLPIYILLGEGWSASGRANEILIGKVNEEVTCPHPYRERSVLEQDLDAWQPFERCKNLPGDYFVIWLLLVSYHRVILMSLVKVDLFRLL